MPYVPAKGDTLLITEANGPHLFIVLTNVSNTGTHLLVNFSSVKPDTYCDNACLVAVGEHDFVTRPTYVEYQFTRIEMASDLSNRVENKIIQVGTPVSPELLARIRAGVMSSKLR